MYAVIKTGGKQYRVTEGETLKIESVAGDVGGAIVLDKVLMVGNGATANETTANDTTACDNLDIALPLFVCEPGRDDLETGRER